MTKEYGVDLAPEPLTAAQTILLPTGAKDWAEKHLEPFDAKKHNTKVIVLELLPISQNERGNSGTKRENIYRDGARRRGKKEGGAK